MIHSGLVAFHAALEPLLVDIDAVRPHPENYNNGDLDAITESIEVNGMYRPIYVQSSTGHIVAGNSTWEVCKGHGATQIPVVELDIDDATARRIVLADNRTASLAVPDNGLLLDLLVTISAEDSLLGTGYNQRDLDTLRHLAQIPPDYDEHATWPLLTFRVPPHVREAFYQLTESAVGDRERFELLLRLAGWDGTRS